MPRPLDTHVAEVRRSSAETARVTAEAVGESDPVPFELAILLHGITQRFERFDRETLRGHGVDAAEYLVLSLLRMAGTAGCTPREMQAALQQTSGGITRCLDRLERKSLVVRTPHEGDRRTVRVALTPKGADEVEMLMRARAATLRGLFEPLGRAGRAALRDDLYVLVATLELALESDRRP
jgi:DNA-binding MarR family transcriptional regulator